MRRHAKAIIAATALLLTLVLGVTFARAVPPSVTIDAPSNVSYTSAHVSGEIDLGAEGGYFYFQYSTDPVNEGWRYGEFQELTAGTGPVGVSQDLTGLKPGSTYFVRILAYNHAEEEATSPEPNPTFTTDPVAEPTVSIDPVTSITDDAAHFSGAINPNAPEAAPTSPEVEAGFKVSWHFECTPACPGAGSGTVVADDGNHSVTGDPEGLDPNTDYEVRLVAENANGPKTVSANFKTSAAAPIVQTLPPAVITDTSAWIGAKVNPRNTATTYYIEYSSDPGFADSVKMPATEDASAGSGNELLLVNHHAEGLHPGATYYYRVVASGAGTTIGEAESFETKAEPIPIQNGLPEDRVYERVTPVDKNGGNTLRTYLPGKAALDGNSVAFKMTGNVEGESGSFTGGTYIAHRAGDRWQAEAINPPAQQVTDVPNAFPRYWWLSEDLTQGLVTTYGALNPGDPPAKQLNFAYTANLYLRDNVTKRYTELRRPSSAPSSFSAPDAITPDEKHFVFTEATGGAFLGPLWLWSQGESRPISILPNGDLINAVIGGRNGGPGDEVPGQHAVSVDAQRAFFASPRSLGEVGLYVRILGPGTPRTELLSGSERSGDDPSVPVHAVFEAASPNGHVAFFKSGSSLTNASTASEDLEGNAALYRWNGDASVGSRLTDITTGDPEGRPRFQGVIGSSEDASTVYFVALGNLAPGATAGKPNVYMWREGEGLTFVATVKDEDKNIWSDTVSPGSETVEGLFGQARVTQDGLYLVFASREYLTAYDTKGTSQLYRYSREAGQISCVSCSGVTPHSEGRSALSSPLIDSPFGCTCTTLLRNNAGFQARGVAEDGSYIIFDSSDALIPSDSNGLIDVYKWTSDGTIRLLSSGDGASDSRFYDASTSGKDIFITTSQRLVASDIDTLIDIYDVRAGGTPETIRRSPCVADECQGTPAPPPSFSTPASSSFHGIARPSRRSRRCQRPKVRRKGNCVLPRKRKAPHKIGSGSDKSRPASVLHGRNH